MKRKRFRRTTIIIVGFVAFLAGLGLARKIAVDDGYIVVLLGLCAAVLFGHKNLATVVLVILFGVSAGVWRGSVLMQKLADYETIYGQQTILTGRVNGDGFYDQKGQLAFEMDNIEVVSPKQKKLIGKMIISGRGVPAVYNGDIVQVEGRAYRTRGARQGGMSFANIKMLDRQPSIVDGVRRRFETGILSALPEPGASFGLGLLVGQRNTLPKVTNDELSAAGLTHLIAVSGYNLTILVRASRRLMGKYSKYQSVLFSVALITLFLMMTGLSASIVRAAIVSGLSITAWYYGRTMRPMVILLASAAITAGWYPVYLWSDIGWYLSFLAFFGVIVFAPALARRVYGPKRQPNAFIALANESIAAQLLTLPIIMFIFGRLSVVSLVANILVVPFTAIAMILSLIAGLAGMFLGPFAGWLSWPGQILLGYMLEVAAVLSRLPFALVHQKIPAWQMVGMYVVLAGATALLLYSNKRKYGKITDKDSVI